MGKVQEVLAKLNTQATPISEVADQLYISVQQDQPDASLPTEATDIRHWLITMDAANSSQGRSTPTASAKTLLRTLRNTNLTDCSPSDRLQIMDVYEKPFTRVMQSLDARYLYLDFPLQTDAEDTFQLAVTLCQEMAIGYKIAVVDTLDGQSNRRRLFAKSRTATRTKRQRAISSAIRHLTHLALRHSQINRNWPVQIWQDLNALACIARHDRANRLTDKANIVQLTVDQQYACLCALSVLHQNNLNAEQTRSLFVKLTRYSDLVTLHSTAQQVNQQLSNLNPEGIYSVGADGPPVINLFRLNKPGTQLFHFRLDLLIEKLKSEAVSESDTLANTREQRKQSRTPRSSIITAETGLQDIYTRISLAQPVEDTESQFTDLKRLLSNNIDESAATQKPLNQRSLLNQSGISESSTNFVVENESAGGMGLRWTGTGICSVQVGELLAHCYRSGHRDGNTHSKEEISWHLSIVRWLRTDADGELRLGVESVSQHTKAVDIVRCSNPARKSQPAAEGLLINYQPIDSKARMLILPRRNYKAGETVAYRNDRHVHIAKLMESVEVSDSYQCFATREVEEEALPELTANPDQYQLAV